MQKACGCLSAIILITSLAGCSYFQFPGVYKISIQQGNIVSQEMVDQLKPGLTKRQVRFILGNPLLTDTFNNNRWDYLYSLRKPNGNTAKKRLTVFFEDDKLTHFTGHFVPNPNPDISDKSSLNTG